MRRVVLRTSDSTSEVLFGNDWSSISGFIDNRKGIIITDENLLSLYGNQFPKYPVITVAPGEKSKSLHVVDKIVSGMLEHNLDRNSFLLGIGGGVVSDLAGFVASIYMRGIDFGFISTSLLSQVDASVGGKNGVNSGTVKNIIGIFNQPRFVICDPTMLTTLPDEEYSQGLAELVKCALISDISLLSLIENEIDSVKNRNTELLEELIYKAVCAKINIVSGDERELGLRRILNFGHTFGHAAESFYGIKHGNAVAWGMMAALAFSESRGYIGSVDRQKAENLIQKLGILPEAVIDGRSVASVLRFDKKREGGSVHFVFLEKPGTAFTEPVGIGELEAFINDFNIAGN